MIKNILLSLSLLLVISCAQTKKSTRTYFGGKIINPKGNVVVLYQNEKALDTFHLDKDNKFLGSIAIKKEGLFYFKHGPEYQFLYLEPQDSLLFRLNTWDFDGTLVFSGKGATRNNMLIDCFLEAEKDSKKFYKNFQLSPKEVKFKIDSTKLIKLEEYNNFVTNNPKESASFNELLKIALTYPLYNRLELYPRLHRSCNKNHKKELSDISSNFYEHRKNININRDSLMYYYTYSSYVTNHLYNLAYEKTHNFSSKFTVNLLHIIDDKLQSEKTKNELLKQTIISHFYNQSNCNNYGKVFHTFFKLNTNIKHKKEIQRLLNDTSKQKTGNSLDDFSMIDFNNTTTSIAKQIKGKNSFIVFWNSKYIGKEYLASRINYLIKKEPNIQFILVKVDGTLHDKIDEIDIKNQFFIDSSSTANSFLTSKFIRTILVDNKGVIANGFTSFYSAKIINQLEQLQK